MNTNIVRSRSMALVVMGLLTACSGGDLNISAEGPPIPRIPPTSSSEAITTHGVITGLGGLTVNGVLYSANAATVTVNGQPGTLSDLRRGQIVTVSGSINDDGQSGIANSIRFDANVIGPVEGLDAIDRRLIVMGQSVIAGPDTIFAAGIDPDTFAGLSVGNQIQVSGFAFADGTIKATRIDSDVTGTELQLIGKVEGLDIANLLFTIHRLTLDYSTALVIDLPGGAPSDGMMVKAIGTTSGGLFIVERLVPAPALSGSSGRRVQTAGLITRFNSPGDFDVNNTPASVDTGTAYQNGAADDLALNSELSIDGDFAANGRITANRVTFGRLASETTTLTFGFTDFTEISVPTVFAVTVTQGPDYSVEVTVDEEVVDRIDVTQTGSRLSIALRTGDGIIETLHASVTMPVLDRIDLTGVVSATLNDFDQTQMTVNVRGVSRLQGNDLTIGNLTARVSGVSQLAFGGVRPIGFADIDVSGVSQATLNMDVGSTLTGSVGTGQGTGVSTLFYYGTNVNVSVTTDFLSSVIRLGGTRP